MKYRNILCRNHRTGRTWACSSIAEAHRLTKISLPTLYYYFQKYGYDFYFDDWHFDLNEKVDEDYWWINGRIHPKTYLCSAAA